MKAKGKTNPILRRQFGDRLFIAGELVKIFTEIRLDDMNKSIHLHNDLWQKIKRVIGDNDTEFRYRVSDIICDLGMKSDEKEEKTRRTVS